MVDRRSFLTSSALVAAAIREVPLMADESQTKEELNILFQNHSKKITADIEPLDIFLQNNDTEGNNILVKYILVDKCRAKLLEKVIDTIYL